MANQDPPLPGTDQAIDPLDRSGVFTLHRELQLAEMFTEREVNLVV